MENAITYFFSTSIPVKNAIELDALLWRAAYATHATQQTTYKQRGSMLSRNNIQFPFISSSK